MPSIKLLNGIVNRTASLPEVVRNRYTQLTSEEGNSKIVYWEDTPGLDILSRWTPPDPESGVSAQYQENTTVTTPEANFNFTRPIRVNAFANYETYVPENAYMNGITLRIWQTNPNLVGKTVLFTGAGSSSSIEITTDYIERYMPQEIYDSIPDSTPSYRRVMEFKLTTAENPVTYVDSSFYVGDDETYARDNSSSPWRLISKKAFYGIQRTYNYDNMVTVGVIGQKAPQVFVNYEYNPPIAPTNLAPEAQTLNPRGEIRFSWNSIINQLSYRLQYRHESTSEWNTVENYTSDRYYILPKNTITESYGKIYWRVAVQEYEEAYSEYANSFFDLGVLPVKKPNVIKPVGDFVDTQNPLTFEWAFDPNPGEVQKTWEIQYSLNSGNTSTTIAGTTETSNTISISDWGSKEAVWRIRVANQFDEWSEWTDWVRFQTMGSPPIPQIISVTNNNKPIINWTSSDQESFLIEIYNIENKLVYSSEKQVSRANRTHEVEGILKNGKYVIHLKVWNIYDVSSPTVAYTHIIDSIPTIIPNIELFDSKYHITVKSDNSSGMVYRDGVYIGDLKGGLFSDYTVGSSKNYLYKVVSIDNQGVASESISKSAKIELQCETIALLSRPDDMQFLETNLDNDPTDNNTIVIDSAAIQVHGQVDPIFEYGEFETVTKSVQYLIDDCRPFQELIRKRELIIFRHRNGEVFIGSITSFNYDRTIWGHMVSFTLTKSEVRNE